MHVPFLDLGALVEPIRGEIDARIRAVVDRSAFVLGADVAGFEEHFARYCRCGHAVGVASGLDAIKLILRALNIGPGDEVITAANSFVASALAVSAVGAVPVLADVDARTCTLTAETIRPHLTSRTRALMPVHLYGLTADMDPILVLAEEYGLKVIEDACQAHGAQYKGRSAGALGHAAAFSFYPGKNLGAFGDGGAVTTDDAALAEHIRAMRNYGSVKKYYHDDLGENSRLDTLQAAVLDVKLPHLDMWNAHRRRVAAWYRERLQGVAEVEMIPIPDYAKPVYHLFVIRVERRDRLMAWLGENGVDALIHYPVPIHMQKAYAGAGWKPGDFPVTEQLADRILSLPMGPHLRQEQVEYVCGLIQAFYGTAGA